MGDDIKSNDIVLKAQKKFLGKMALTSLTKLVIDPKTSEVLDEFYKILKLHTGEKKDAERLLKNIIKVMVKLTVLEKNNQFSKEELGVADKLQKNTRLAAMTLISFYEVDFTFDKYVLSQQVNEQRNLIQSLVSAHLTEKSKHRINSVYDVLGDTEFLEKLFEPNSKYRPSIGVISSRLSQLLKDGVI